MGWIRTCLLSTALGTVGAATAGAQTGVTLSRPQPLNAPSSPGLPEFVLTRPAPSVVRAQAGGDEGKLKTAAPTVDPPRLPDPAQPSKKDDSPPEKKSFIAPPPKAVYWQRNPWTGAKEGVVLEEGAMVICESD